MQGKVARDGWLAKNVTPILYDSREGHALLIGESLIEWARYAKRPQVGVRRQIALNGISKLPAVSNDPVVERFVPSLDDPVNSRALAEAASVFNEVDFPKIERWL